MLIKNINIKRCINSIVDSGDCCCNCNFLYIQQSSISNGLEHFCRLKFDSSPDILVSKLSSDHHGLCECWTPVSDTERITYKY